MRKLIFLVLAFAATVFFAQSSRAQMPHADSLELCLKDKQLSAVEKLRVYDDLSWELLDKDFVRSSEVARQGIQLAKQEGNRVMEATLIRNLGVAYYMDSRLDSAEIILSEALRVATSAQDAASQAGAYVALGNLYNVQSRYNIAIDHYNKALPLYKKLGRTDRIYTIHANIGALYSSRGNYPQAERYLLAAQKTARAQKDIAMQARIAQNLSNVYFAISRAKESYQYAKEAVSLCREAGDDYNEVLALTSLSGACHTYLKDNDLARQYAVEALEKAQKIQIPNLISAALRNRAYAYYRDTDYKKAKETAIECLELTDSTDLSQRVAMNSTLLESYIQLGEKVKAEETFHLVYELMNRQSDERMSQAISEMEVKYETNRKEEHIAMLSEERSLFIALSITGATVVVLLLITLLLMNRYQRQKRLRMEEQLRISEQEKLLLAAQSLLDGENRERGRLSRELHDGLGGMLTMIKMSLNQMKQQTSSDFEKVLGFVDSSICEMRKMAHNIMPESILKFGLVPTLGEFCKNFPNVSMHVYGEMERYREKVEINFYRIACELINNALKHSDATRINVQLITAVDKISLSVQDNGVGFSLEEHPEALQTVKSRVEVLGATIDILSTKDEGTEVTVELNIC